MTVPLIEKNNKQRIISIFAFFYKFRKSFYKMMNIDTQLKELVQKAMLSLYGAEIPAKMVQVEITRKDQQGDFTVVVFPLLKFSKKSPEITGTEIGSFIKDNFHDISSFNVIKGFLNLVISHRFWLNLLNDIYEDENYGIIPLDDNSPLVMVEYSSPNTNKPLHLGHIRNNLLGFSLSRILQANGKRVVKTNLVNDRGIHICKSMLAWQKWAKGSTPESTGIKGDHLVGDYYVKFDQAYKEELKALESKGMSSEEAEQNSVLMKEVRTMLQQWEAGDIEVIDLWKMMNQWVYNGFDITYDILGIDFDKIYYESDTYSLGREMVYKGLEEGVFFKKDDGSVWVDLSDKGLDEKILLRSDGTSVYITQDIGTARLRFDDYPIDEMIYVVGNEQDYHFKVLSVILDKLGFSWGKDLIHFSYGMVELPDGKMKSREGTVVDADDLIEEMNTTSRTMSSELGKLEGYTEEQTEEVVKMTALGALKYFILKVDPRKNMTFDPKESIDFNGNTGPFIQYTHARICSIFRKAEEKGIEWKAYSPDAIELNNKENNLIRYIANFKNIVKEAGNNYSPAIIANYIYELAKEFNQFYHESPVLFEEDENVRAMRLMLCGVVGRILKKGMYLLGAGVPDRM